MNCYDGMNNLVKGVLFSCPISYPKRGIFRDEANNLYMVEIGQKNMKLGSDKISSATAYEVAEKCIAGVSVQGSMNGAMNAMAVTMIAAFCQYEQIIADLGQKISVLKS